MGASNVNVTIISLIGVADSAIQPSATPCHNNSMLWELERCTYTSTDGLGASARSASSPRTPPPPTAWSRPTSRWCSPPGEDHPCTGRGGSGTRRRASVTFKLLFVWWKGTGWVLNLNQKRIQMFSLGFELQIFWNKYLNILEYILLTDYPRGIMQLKLIQIMRT